MTFREVGRDEVLEALGDGGDDSVLRTCVAALRADAQAVYTVGGSPAKILRETLEVKYRLAASRGKTFIGDDDLLLRLRELGNDLVSIVSAHRAGGHFFIFVMAGTLKPVGAVIMYDAESDRSDPE